MRDLTAEMECTAAGVPEAEIRAQSAGYDTESEWQELLTDSESDTEDDDWTLADLIADPDYDPEYPSAPVYVEAEEPEDPDYFEDENHQDVRPRAQVKEGLDAEEWQRSSSS